MSLPGGAGQGQGGEPSLVPALVLASKVFSSGVGDPVISHGAIVPDLPTSLHPALPLFYRMTDTPETIASLQTAAVDN